jgi:hypothetical protein
MPAPDQFFRKPETPRTPEAEGSNRAIYRVPGKTRDGEPLTIAVECVEGGGNVPRNAASFQGIARRLDIEEELAAVAAVAESVLNSLKAARPGAVEIEFGVELGGEMGIPLLTKGEAKANFKVTLKWSGKEEGGNA